MSGAEGGSGSKAGDLKERRGRGGTQPREPGSG